MVTRRNKTATGLPFVPRHVIAIAQYLAPYELAQCASINKQWRAIVGDRLVMVTADFRSRAHHFGLDLRDRFEGFALPSGTCHNWRKNDFKKYWPTFPPKVYWALTKTANCDVCRCFHSGRNVFDINSDLLLRMQNVTPKLLSNSSVRELIIDITRRKDAD